MNYNDIVRLRYPDYILTYVGTGEDYYALQWNEFNPSPNPIPKATLDADISDAIASGVTGTLSDITPSGQDELAAVANVEDGVGLVKKMGQSTYTLDKNTYLTGITSSLVTTALGFTPYNSSNPSQYVSKAYVDNLSGNGVLWQAPVHGFNFVGTASSPPATPHANENYIINYGGNVGAWSSFNPGDRVSWVNNAWVLREVTSVGCRLGVCFDQTTTGIGDALGKDNQIGEIIGGNATDGWIWEWTVPLNNFAVFNNYTGSTKFGESYTYIGSSSTWLSFSSNIVGDGDGLSFSGNTLNVNIGKGIELVSDNVTVKVHPSGGIITSLDGTTSSSDPSAGLALEPIGTAGTYTKMVVDTYGRITSGSNPTSLSGYGITDAVNTNLLGVTVATLDNNGKLKPEQTPNFDVQWSSIINTPNSLSGYGIIDGLSSALLGVNNGIATLDSTGKVTSTQLPNSVDKLTTARSISATGDAIWTVSFDGSINVSSPLTLSTVNSNVGTFNTVTVNSKGLVTAASNTTYTAASIGAVANAGSIVSIQSGLASALPTAGTLGRLYITTDTGLIYRDTGTTWVIVGSSNAGTGGGSVYQTVSGTYGASSGTTLITAGNTLPTTANGSQIWTASITPNSASSKVRVSSSFYADCDTNIRSITVALFRGTTCIQAQNSFFKGSGQPMQVTLEFVDSPASSTSVTYSMRIGVNNSATWYVNQDRTGGIVYGGTVNKSTYILQEIL